MSGEKIGEPTSANTEKHPLGDMPSFDDYIRQSDTSAEEVSEAQIDESDKLVEKVFDKLGHGVGENYFSDPGMLVNLTKDALSMTPQQAISSFKSQIEGYKAKATEHYQEEATRLYEQTRDNIQRLVKEQLVGDDTIKVFLSPDYISSAGRGSTMSEYNVLQADFSRRDSKNWRSGSDTYIRYQMRVKELADSFAENGGDITYQEDISGEDTTYDASKPIVIGGFFHVNSNKPREKGGLRCYITPDKTRDPSAVLYAWKESVQDSPLKDSLYFKFATSMEDSKDDSKQRLDDIVIYKTDNIDDGQFKSLLQDFQRRCNEMSPDLLPSDDKKMPATTQKIANGISIAGEPGYVNDYLRYTDHKGGKHSWTTFVDKMAMLSTSVAANRLGIQPDSIDAPGLEKETKKVFREFMLLSKINPDTMLPAEYGDERPAWANLSKSTASDEAPRAIEYEQGVDPIETSSDNAASRRQIYSGERSSMYAVENTNGESSTQIESDYFNMAEQFIKSHDELKDNAGLRDIISGLSTDLALIDATHGRNFESGNEKLRSSLLEDYSALRARLTNPASSPEEKQLISEYLDSMQGDALKFLENHYTLEQIDEPPLDNDDEQKERLSLELDEAKKQLEIEKNRFTENSADLEIALSKAEELFDGRSVDLDDLRAKLSNLINANEELDFSTKRLNNGNEEYESTLAKNKKFMNEEEYLSAREDIISTREATDSVTEKITNASFRIAQIRSRISEIEDSLRIL